MRTIKKILVLITNFFKPNRSFVQCKARHPDEDEFNCCVKEIYHE